MRLTLYGYHDKQMYLQEKKNFYQMLPTIKAKKKWERERERKEVT